MLTVLHTRCRVVRCISSSRRILPLFLAALFALLLGGCGDREKYKQYEEAKRLANMTKERRSPDGYYYSYDPKRAAEIFNTLGDYKDSRELHNKAMALYIEECYRDGVSILERVARDTRVRFSHLDGDPRMDALRKLSAVGDYKDAADRVMALSLSMTDELLREKRFNELPRLLGELNEAQKDKNAKVIRQFALGMLEKLLVEDPETSSALDNDARERLRHHRHLAENGPPHERGHHDTLYDNELGNAIERKLGPLLQLLEIAGKATPAPPDGFNEKIYNMVMRSDLGQALESLLPLLKTIRETSPALRAGIDEKIYKEVLRNFNKKDFWAPISGDAPRARAGRLLGMLGDYKNSKELARRCEKALENPVIVIKTEELEAQFAKAGAGAHPQPRTISVILADGSADGSGQMFSNSFCLRIKHLSAGGVYLSDNAGNACALLYYTVRNSYWRSFDYHDNNGHQSTRHYYNTSIDMELREPGGKVLYAKTFSYKWEDPQERIEVSTADKRIKYGQPDDESIKEMLKVLETQFDGMRTPPP